MKTSILIPSRDGIEYLKLALDSIIHNSGSHDVEIIVLDDNSVDGTFEYISNNYPFVQIIQNTDIEYKGISSGYKFLSKFATKEIICHWHNDMVMLPGTLDAVESVLFDKIHYVDVGGMSSSEIDSHLFQINQNPNHTDYKFTLVPNEKNVVCLTRIEPPIYGEQPCKIVWKDAPLTHNEFNISNLLEFLPTAQKEWQNKTTEGHFAPFFMFTSEYRRLGGADTINFPRQGREDSDKAFRLALDGFKTIQIPQFVYHFGSRGNRRAKDIWNDSPEWIEINRNSEKNFVRKWQTFHPLHDDYLKPRKPVRYKTSFIIKRCNPNLLELLEPWCDYLDCDLDNEQLDQYVSKEQPNTKFDLNLKFHGKPDVEGIVVRIDGNTFNDNDYKNIQYLSQIIEQNEELGQFELGNLKIDILDLTHYERDLICIK